MDKDTKIYPIEQAVEAMKVSSKEKFDASVEIHINLSIEKGAPIRFTTTLPHGTGKTKKVAAFAPTKIENADLNLEESDIEKIIKGDIKPKVDFDVLVAHPSTMSKIAKAARVLGPAGAMPNPKTGTVAEDVAKAVEEVKKGKMDVRREKDAPIIHTIVGKKSFTKEALTENIEALIKAMKANKPQKAKPDWIGKVFITTSMGRSFQIEVE
jgi:large subunit ribosomal protein L1